MLKTVVHGDVFVIVDEKLRPTLSRCFKLSSWVRLTDILTTVPDGHPPVSHLEGTPIALKRQDRRGKKMSGTSVAWPFMMTFNGIQYLGTWLAVLKNATYKGLRDTVK